MLKYFNNARVLGVTATPDRNDKKDLSTFFDSIAFEYPIAQAVKDGYLSPIRAKMILLNIDLTNVRTSCGDYISSDLGNALEPYLEQIADEMTKLCFNRKTVVFLPLVAISQLFCELLNSKGFHAIEVNGECTDRKEILSDFESGKYNVICNSMLLTEGWDCPAVDCIVNLRPTKSRSLYTQIVGRGMRLYPGKKELLLLDFLWMTAKLSLCRPSCIIAKDAEHAKNIDLKVERANDGIDILEAGKQAETDIVQQRKKALAKELEAQRRKKAKFVDPLQFIFSIEENLDDYEPTFKWELEPPTQKQIELIEKFNISAEGIDSRGKATKLIDVLMRRVNEHLSTAKQIRLLERYGFKSVGTWTFTEASDMINHLAANHWIVPEGIVASQYTPQK